MDGVRVVAKEALDYETPVLFSESESVALGMLNVCIACTLTWHLVCRGNITYLMAKDKDSTAPGEALAAVERVTGDFLLVHQDATVLSCMCLQLASDKVQEDTIGGFGEGFKMAALTCSRATMAARSCTHRTGRRGASGSRWIPTSLHRSPISSW
jgi:hypothetical protein